MSPIAPDIRPLVAALAVAAVSALAGCGGDGHRPSARKASSPTPTATRAGGGASPSQAPPRTHDAVVREIAGRRVRAGGRAIRLERATLTCGGIGDATADVHGRPAWTRFSCIQPTFPKGGVAGPDLLFTVASAPPQRLVVEHARLSTY